MLLQLYFELTDQVVALSLDLVLPREQLAPQLGALGFKLTLALLMSQLFFERG